MGEGVNDAPSPSGRGKTISRFDKLRSGQSRDDYKTAYTNYLLGKIPEQELLQLIDDNAPYLESGYNDRNIMEADVLIGVLVTLVETFIEKKPDAAAVVECANEWRKRVNEEYYGK